jgi:hypothetical protein
MCRERLDETKNEEITKEWDAEPSESSCLIASPSAPVSISPKICNDASPRTDAVLNAVSAKLSHLPPLRSEPVPTSVSKLPQASRHSDTVPTSVPHAKVLRMEDV